MGGAGGAFLLDVLKGTLLTLVLFLAYVMVPVAGFFPGLFTPLPGMFYACKRGAMAAALIVVLATTVLLVLGERTVPLLYLLQYGVITLVVPALYRQGKGAARAIVLAVGVNAVLVLVLAGGYGVATGVDLKGLVLQGIQANVKQAVGIYEKQGLKGEDLQLLTQGMEQAARMVGRVFPALALITLGAIAGLNLLFLSRLSGRLPSLPEFSPFQAYRNPEPLVWVVIVAGFAMLLPAPAMSSGALNVLLVAGTMYFIQGLAILQYTLDRLATPRLLRIIGYLILAIQPYLVLPIAVLGIFDIWGDFRTPRTKNL
ncbi:MAG TPA: YybS family protein [Geobacteraceae bacterium]